MSYKLLKVQKVSGIEQEHNRYQYQSIFIKESCNKQNYQPFLRYKHVAFMFTLFWIICPCLAATDVSFQNCPSQYNISNANVTSETQISLVESFYGGLSNDKDRDRVQNIVLSGDYQDLGLYTRQKMIPYGIVAGLVLLLFLIILYYCLLDKSFPPCQSFRRNPIQSPYSVGQKRFMSWVLLFLCIGIFTTGIISFTAIPKMRESIEYTKCSIYNLLDLTMNGDTSDGWAGYISLKNKLGNISSLLDSTNTQINTYLTGDFWLVDDMMILQSKNIQIYSMNQQAQYITPNPQTTQINIQAGEDYPTVDSVFIRTGMGPNGTDNTMVNEIDQYLRATSVKSKQGFDLEVSARTLVESSANIKSNSIAVQNELSMYLHQLSITKNETDTFSQQFFEVYFTAGIYVLQGVVGFILVSSLLILIGGLSTHFYQILQCRYMVHCGWFLYSIMYFGLLALAFATLSMGTAGYYACEYFESALEDQTAYAKMGEQYWLNMFKKLDGCILGDGNSLQRLKINSQMHIVTDLFTNLSQYYDYDNTFSSNFINMSIATQKIENWLLAIQNYRLGIYIDSRPQQTNNDNPNYALNKLNQFTNGSKNANNQVCALDHWVYDVQNCTNANQEVYQSDATLAHGTELSVNRGVVLCISLNEKIMDSADGSWSQSDFTSRYIQIREKCNQTYNQIISFGQSIINFRDSRLKIYQGIKDQLTDLLALSTNFNSAMATFRNKVDQFYEAVATLNNVVSNQETGLMSSSNCSTIGRTARATYNIFCINFMAQTAKVGICTLVMLVLVMGGMFAGVIFAVRYANVEILRRVDAEAQEVLEISSTDKVDQQIMFSQRSHSSEDDDKDKGRDKVENRKGIE